jgi:hypothetical protein
MLLFTLMGCQSVKCSNQRAYFSSPELYMCIEAGGMIFTGEI